MDRYASGDDAAFSEVYDALAPRLYSFLLRLVRNSAAAEDLLQQTFLNMHNARFRFVAGSDVTPWAFAIARRVFLDHARSARRKPLVFVSSAVLGESLVTSAGSTGEEAESREAAEALETCLAEIPEAHRTAFQLVKQEGLSMAEAANVLGVTIATVKIRAHRTYVALRQSVAKLRKSGVEK